MKNRIEIRKITLRSLDAFYTFFKKNFALLFPEYNKKEIRFILKARWGWSRKRYRELLEEKDRIILGAYDGRKIVGILDAELPEAGVSECDWIMVHKDYQGKGIGKELMKEWERIVKKMGGHMLFLDAKGTNASLYIKRGFYLVGSFSKGWFGKDTYIFTKIIQNPREKNYLK